MSTGLRAGTNNDGYLQVNGTDVLTALSSGRIGIGTTGPARKVEIVDTAATVLQLNSTSSDGTSLRILHSGNDKMYMGLAGDFIIGQANNVTDSAIRSNGSLLFASGGGTERLRITTTGELISTNGTLRRNVETSSFALSGGTASNSGANIVVYGNNHSSEANVIRFRVGGTESARITSDGKVRLPDNGKLTLGAGDDLQIWSDNTDQYIRGEQNQLIVRSNNLRLQSYLGENYIHCAMNNAVSLYYDNSKKFETTSTGATVTGTLDLAAISSSISDTAVDVFVYDTRKDSDGGAWRKRTQNTSWYNETLNTSTRGSRKEFPAVAVIVATTGSVFIYDGDDPDLPLWMKFNQSTNGLGAMVGYTSFTIGCVTMLNGLLMVGLDATNQGNVAGLRLINFITEQFSWKANDSSRNSSQHWPIEDRNGGRGLGHNDENYIVSEVINDVAATVLPNSQINDATGLPVPTIAVATNNGVSVIRDDGTVFDVIDSNGARKCYDVSFTKDHKIMHTGDLGAGSTHAGNVFVTNILTADRAEYDNHSDLYRWYSTSQYYPRINGGNTFNTRVLDPIDVGGNHYAMADVGVSLIEDGTSSSYGNTDGMVAYITSDYNSGYQHGDIKGAFLSDTDTTNITGTSLIANGDFSSNSTAAFTTVAGGTAEVTGGLLKLTDTGGSFVYASAPFTTVIGNQYFVTVDIVNNSNTAPSNYIRCGNSHNATQFHNTNYGTSYGTKTFYFTATATTTYLTLISGHGAGNPFGHWDNIFVYKLDNDRSINSKGLIAYGTVTKSAVATGADLVGYSGFSNSNYLKQPHNTDLELGTGEISITAWFRSSTTDTSNYKGLIYLNGPGTLGPGLQVMFGPDNGIYLFVYGASGSQNFSGNYHYGYNDGGWHQVTVTTRPYHQQIFVDGVLKQTGTVNTGSLTNAASELYIGKWYGNTNSAYYWRGDAALVRVSRSIPSHEQIKKMYNDEKHLFVENAKATLYGTSDAVTTLAYDDSTNLLYTGTSAGRSEFQGLRRINNTTTAVTTAISASNGLVAEQ